MNHSYTAIYVIPDEGRFTLEFPSLAAMAEWAVTHNLRKVWEPIRFGEFQALRADGSRLTREEHFAFVDLLKSTPPASPLFPREYPGDIPALELLPRPLNLSRKCSKIHAMSNSRSV